MGIDRSNPKFREYSEKFKRIASEQEEELRSLKASKGKDGGSSTIMKRYAIRIKNLQKEYSFLFSED